MMKYVEEVQERVKNDEYNGTFTSWQIIDNSGFVDLLFIGTFNDTPVVWNTCITTARGDYYELVNNIAMDEGYEKYPNPEDYNFFDSFVDVDDEDISDDDLKYKGCKQYVDPHPELSELRWKFIAERTMELLDSGTISMPTWNIEIDEEYEYGIGLHVRMDKDFINVDDIKTFISQFNEHGVDVFKILGYDMTPRYFSSIELGVELKDDSNFVTWVDGFSRCIVGIKDDLDFLDEIP